MEKEMRDIRFEALIDTLERLFYCDDSEYQILEEIMSHVSLFDDDTMYIFDYIENLDEKITFDDFVLFLEEATFLCDDDIKKERFYEYKRKCA